MDDYTMFAGEHGSSAVALARMHIIKQVELEQVLSGGSFRVATLALIEKVKNGTAEPLTARAFIVANARRGLGKMASWRSIYRWADTLSEGGSLRSLMPEDGRFYEVSGDAIRPVTPKMTRVDLARRQRRERRLAIKRDIVYWIRDRAEEMESSYQAIAREVSEGEYTMILHPDEPRHPTDAYLHLLKRYHIKGGRRRAFISLRTLENWRSEVERADEAAEHQKALSKIRAKRARKSKGSAAQIVSIDGQSVNPDTAGILFPTRSGYSHGRKKYTLDYD